MTTPPITSAAAAIPTSAAETAARRGHHRPCTGSAPAERRTTCHRRAMRGVAYRRPESGTVAGAHRLADVG
jgi:hypothetical protein